MPSLIWVPSGAADKKDIIIPLDNFFKRMNVRHVVGCHGIHISNTAKILH
jgi:sulfide:quinone oxidoreductase